MKRCLVWNCNIILLTLCNFVFLLSFVSKKYWGNIGIVTLEQFSCANCIDKHTLYLFCIFLLTIFLISFILAIYVCRIFRTKEDDKNNPFWVCAIFWVGIFAYLFYKYGRFEITITEFIFVYVLLSAFYFFYHGWHGEKIVFLWLCFFVFLVLELSAYWQPVLFKFEAGPAFNDNSLENISINEKRNLIVIYDESFNKKYSSFIYRNKRYAVNDKKAVHFKYFKQGIRQECTRLALEASFTGKHPVLGGKINTSISNLTKDNGFQNIFVQGGNINWLETKKFLLASGFDEDNIYGVEGGDYKGCSEDEKLCFLKNTPQKRKTLFWADSIADRDVFLIFKQKISELDRNKPFFAVMFTMNLHVGTNPYFESFEEAVVDNIMLLNNFIDWFEHSDFYENTTLIILADHARMGEKNREDEILYNAFFNLPERLTENLNTNRIFNQTDMFLTMLKILGFNLPKNKIGVSASLFSQEKTYAEEYSFYHKYTAANKFMVVGKVFALLAKIIYNGIFYGA